MLNRLELPRDEDDCRFVRSFTWDDDNMIAFFEEYGFVVIGNVFSTDECAATREAMVSIMELANPGFCLNRPETWDSVKTTGKYGLSTRGPCFDRVLVNNRQNESLISAISRLIHADREDVIVSHDRFTIYRPTMSDDPEKDHSSFSTGPRNIHLDMNPWWWEESSADVIQGVNKIDYGDPQDFIKENNLVVRNMGRHVQCVLNFMDNFDEDGGTLVVPGFHKHISEWNKANARLRKNLPWVTFPKEVEDVLLSLAQRICMREGSVLIWDQTVAHGTAPNASRRFRMAQYLKAGSRSRTYSQIPSLPLYCAMKPDVNLDKSDSKGKGKPKKQQKKVERIEPPVGEAPSQSRLLRRSVALRRHLMECGAYDIVSDLGRFVFGLDVLNE